MTHNKKSWMPSSKALLRDFYKTCTESTKPTSWFHSMLYQVGCRDELVASNIYVNFVNGASSRRIVNDTTQFVINAFYRKQFNAARSDRFLQYITSQMESIHNCFIAECISASQSIIIFVGSSFQGTRLYSSLFPILQSYLLITIFMFMLNSLLECCFRRNNVFSSSTI